MKAGRKEERKEMVRKEEVMMGKKEDRQAGRTFRRISGEGRVASDVLLSGKQKNKLVNRKGGNKGDREEGRVEYVVV